MSKRATDNLYTNPISLEQYMLLRENEVIYRRSVKLTPEALDLLLTICSSYLKTGKSITAYYIGKLLNSTSTGEFRNVKFKLSRLIEKGYVEVVGTTKNAYLYAPTLKALRELEELVK
jgi:hypothetical protein